MATLSRPIVAFGTFSIISLWDVFAWEIRESMDENFLLHLKLEQPKCLAFWWWCRIIQFLKDLSQQKQKGRRQPISRRFLPIILILKNQLKKCLIVKISPILKIFQQRKPNMEKTFIMIKPDGVQRGLVGKIICRFEAKGYFLLAMKMKMASDPLLREHYADHVGRSFFPGLLKYMLAGPVVAMVWEGKNAVSAGRKLLGETQPTESSPGTIRGDFCIDVGRNLIHGSDSVESANKEIALWFPKEEICQWKSHSGDWIYE